MRSLLVSLLCVSVLFAGAVSEGTDEDYDDDVTVETEEDEEAGEDVPYASPEPPRGAFLAEHFDDPAAFEKRWTRSKAKKDDIDEDIAKYDGLWSVESLKKHGLQGDRGMVLKSKAKHAAISSRLDRPFHFLTKPLVVQYEVNLQNGQECGGAYLKLLSDSPDLDPAVFRDKTPYTIMFGPDKCGNDNKLHFIFRHRNPVTGDYEEKHAKRPSANIDHVFTDKNTHLYKLVVRPDNSFEISIDDKVVNSGNLLEDMTPPVNPPAEIEDTEDKKPTDWDEREKIADPDATKPDDWDEDAPAKITDPDATMPAGWLEDEPEMISDPEAEKPNDWDTEMDGEWEAPLITNPACAAAPGCGIWSPPAVDNPAYKGKWRAPMIDNPDYRGKWAPRKIANPAFFEDLEPFKMTSIGAVGMELWSMMDDIYFDNLLITDSLVDARQFMEETYALKLKQRSSKEGSVVQKFLKYSNERPWLYAVYLVTIGLPLVLVFYLCCFAGSKREEMDRKKTDEPEEDDAEPEEGAEQPDEDTSHLRTREDTSEQDAAQDAEQAGRSDDPASGDVGAEDEQEDHKGSEGEQEAPGAGGEGDARRTSPRRRRPRRD